MKIQEEGKICLFFFFKLHWVLVAVCWLSLVLESRDHSLIVICGLLIVVASFAAEHWL